MNNPAARPIIRERLEWFLLLLTLVVAPLPAADVTSFVLAKGQEYYQTTPGIASLDTEAPFLASLSAEFSEAGVCTGIQLLPPGSAPIDFQVPATDSDWGESESHRYREDLAAATPGGTYTATFSTLHDGPASLSLTLEGEDYPSVPLLVNLTAAQAIDPTGAFEFAWTPFDAGTEADFVRLMLEDTEGTPLFSTGPPDAPDALNGTDTLLALPPNTLASGQTYDGFLLFARLVDRNTTSYPGATGLAAYYTATSFEVRTTGSAGPVTPALDYVSPATGDTMVSPHASIVFAFQTPMRPEVAIVWSANLAGIPMAYSWQSDRQVLFCIPQAPLPGNSEVGWVLNPSGQPADLRSLDGTPLPTQSGGFHTSESIERPPDLTQLFLLKGHEYRQTGPEPISLDVHVGALFADLESLNAVSNTTLRFPDGRQAQLAPDRYGDLLEFVAEYGAAADLERFVPDGAYRLDFDTVHDGRRSLELQLSGGAFPAPPTVLDMEAAQQIDPATPFRVTWDAFAGATEDDFIVVELKTEWDDDVFEDAPFLPATADGLDLPAKLLWPGRFYLGSIRFVRVVDQVQSVDGDLSGIAAYLSTTHFELRTIGLPIAPRLEILAGTGFPVQLRVFSEPGRPYGIDATSNLADPDSWWPLWFHSSDSGVADFVDPDSESLPTRFYRVLDGAWFGFP